VLIGVRTEEVKLQCGCPHKPKRVLHVYQLCTIQLFMMDIIIEVILKPLASQRITVHAQHTVGSTWKFMLSLTDYYIN
jgi:hypothetical protein